ncbi:hypothetical protein FNYG_12762 [Fusarium nygamai]|uniref:Uncharacterized protein n=1 Tax=Gibberella nygamai TaxID=42673 RepID=A0A2K0VV44_GIBNY|nr:hypothetical protein FNYG_12762 [Fusarium nygamai]
MIISTFKDALTPYFLVVFNILIKAITILTYTRKEPIPLRTLCVGLVGGDDSISSFISGGGYGDGLCYDEEYGDFRLEPNPPEEREVDGIILLGDASMRDYAYWVTERRKPFEMMADNPEYSRLPKLLERIRNWDQEHISNSKKDLELGLPASTHTKSQGGLHTPPQCGRPL